MRGWGEDAEDPNRPLSNKRLHKRIKIPREKTGHQLLILWNKKGVTRQRDVNYM